MIVANNRFLKRVNPEITRARTDAGASLVSKQDETQVLMRQMVDLGIADNLKLWVHNGLVKTRTSGSDTFVPKAYDISGEENDAAQATTNYQPKLVSNGLKFDGVYRLIMSAPPVTNQLSFVVWFKPTTNGDNWIIHNLPIEATATQLFQRNLSANYIMACRIETVNGALVTNTTTELVENSFYFIVATYDGNSLKVYINNSDESIEVVTGGSGDMYTSGDWAIGYQFSSTHLKGDINDIRIFNSALSAAQITAIFNETKGKYGIT